MEAAAALQQSIEEMLSSCSDLNAVKGAIESIGRDIEDYQEEIGITTQRVDFFCGQLMEIHDKEIFRLKHQLGPNTFEDGGSQWQRLQGTIDSLYLTLDAKERELVDLRGKSWSSDERMKSDDSSSLISPLRSPIDRMSASQDSYEVSRPRVYFYPGSVTT